MGDSNVHFNNNVADTRLFINFSDSIGFKFFINVNTHGNNCIYNILIKRVTVKQMYLIHASQIIRIFLFFCQISNVTNFDCIKFY